jgi:hypothetical protein
MAVEWCSESLLVEMVTNETDAAAKDEETVQRANLDVFICLFPSECSTVTKKVNKADRDATVDVENELDIIVRLHTEPGKCENVQCLSSPWSRSQPREHSRGDYG